MTNAHNTVWLQGNQRLMWLCLVPLGLLSLLGLSCVWFLSGNVLAMIAGWVMLVVGATLSLLILRVGRSPRIAIHESEVLFYLPGPQPIRVPLEYVECFFLGSGITQLPGSTTRDVQTRNLVVRMAERATDWQHRELPLHLGKWCEGYLTIRGLYCEPLTIDVIKHLNTVLHQAHQATATSSPVSSAVPNLVQGQEIESPAASQSSESTT